MGKYLCKELHMTMGELPYEADLIILQSLNRSIEVQRLQEGKKAIFQRTFF